MSSKTHPSLVGNSRSPRSVLKNLCARAIVFVFLPYAGKRSPDSLSVSRTVMKPPCSENRSSETSTESTMAVQLPGWETTKRYAANCTLALKTVVLGCGPLLVTAACVTLFRAVENGGGGAVNRRRLLSNSGGEAQQRLSEQNEYENQERLQQYISSISYRQRRIKRNLLCASELDSVSRLVSCRVADATSDDMASIVADPVSAYVDDRCAICLEPNSSGEDQVRILSCSHAFHAPCIDPWLTTCCGMCPLCKIQLQPNKQ